MYGSNRNCHWSNKVRQLFAILQIPIEPFFSHAKVSQFLARFKILYYRPTITLALVLTAAMVTAIGSEPGTLQASTFEIHGVFRKKIEIQIGNLPWWRWPGSFVQSVLRIQEHWDEGGLQGKDVRYPNMF